jgi:hypothetical protein
MAWHVCDDHMRHSYGEFANPVDALKHAIKLLRTVKPDAYGEHLFYKENSRDWGTLYYHIPMFNIMDLPSDEHRISRVEFTGELPKLSGAGVR